MLIFMYVLSIVSANVLTAYSAPLNVFGFLIPAGSFLIGATFLLRDGVQMCYGRRTAYIVILSALLVSAVFALYTGSGLRIVLASALAFGISEAADTELFTRLKGSIGRKVGVSGAIGGSLDSIIFVVAAGFPLMAIPGQLVIKVIMQGWAALIIKRVME